MAKRRLGQAARLGWAERWRSDAWREGVRERRSERRVAHTPPSGIREGRGRRVACREGRRLYIHVYKYMFIQPAGRLQGGEAPAGRTAATPMRRATAGGGDRAVRGRERGYDSDVTRM